MMVKKIKRNIQPTKVNFVKNKKVSAQKVTNIEGTSSQGDLRIKPLLVTKKALLMEVHRRKGLIDSEHQHNDHESICYLVSGRMRAYIEGEEFIANPGDSWIHKPGIVHYHETLEDSIQLELKIPPKKTWD